MSVILVTGGELTWLEGCVVGAFVAVGACVAGGGMCGWKEMCVVGHG